MIEGGIEGIKGKYKKNSFHFYYPVNLGNKNKTPFIVMNTPISALTVVKSNSVIQASYRLTLAEQRLLLTCIAQIDSKKTITDQIEFEVTANAIDELAGLEKHKSSYRDLKKASDSLLKRVVRIEKPDPEIPNLAYTATHWVDFCDYYPSEGKVVVCFAKKIIPYLSQLSANFTQYKLRYVTKMKSVYGIRLYELLAQWQSTGEREIDIAWLRQILQIEDKYSAIKDLKKYVIEPALLDINQHSNFWVQYTQRKTGRSVTHFQFQFGLRQQKNEQTTKEKHTKMTVERFVQENPELTRGKSRPEVLNMMGGKK